MTGLSLLLLALAPACSDKDTTTGADSGVTDLADSGQTDSPTDTDADTGETGTTTDTEETGETGLPTDTQDTEDADSVTPGALDVYPRELVVDPGAEWTLRTVYSLDGELADVEPTSWTSSDEAVLTVSIDGVATALSPGSATLTATWEGLDALSAVTVQATPTLKVSLVRSEDGMPVTAGKIRYDGTTVEVDSLTGSAELTVPAGEPVWVTCWSTDTDRIPATVMQVIGRQLVVPLRAQGAAAIADAEIGGAYDFGGVPPLSDDEKAAGYIVLGLAGSSMPWGPLYWRPDELLSPDRDATLYGLDVAMPGNITIMEEVETWTTPAWSGDAGVWSLAGPVPLADAVAGLSDLSSALDFLLENIDGFVYGYDGALKATVGTPLELDVRPSTSLSETVEVELPAWPAGFDGSETAMLLALDGDGAEGPTVVGFGRGFPGTAHTSRAPGTFFGWDGSAEQVLAYLELGGAGSGGARVLSAATVVDGVATIGEFHEPPSLDSFDGGSHDLEFTSDADAHVVHFYITSKDGTERDYYLPSVSSVVNIPAEGPSFGWGVTEWEMTVLQADSGTFESWAAEGALLRETLSEHAVTTSFLNHQFGGS